MRTITLLAVLLAVSQLYAEKAPAFEKGKKYTYAYKSRIATGVADEAHQFSGFGFIGNLVIQNDQNDVVFQFQDVKVGAVNGQHEHMMEEMEMPYSKPSNGEQMKMFQEFEKPFWVEFDNGVVKSMYFQQDDHTPDYNVKKAIATLFQTDFRKDGVPNPNMYTVKEDGIGGECDTMYQIGHYPDMDSPNVEVMNVTKIRQYGKCTHRPHLLHTSFLGQLCRECSQQNFRPLRSLGQVNYDIKGTRDHFTIEKLHSTGAIVLTPFTTNGQTVISVVNQTLTLVKEEGATPIAKPGNLEKVTSLSYTYNDDHRDTENVDLKAAHYADKIYNEEHSNHMTEAERYLGELQKAMKEYTKESTLIAKLITEFQHFNYDEWVQFGNKNIWQDEKMKNMMTEIIPLVGTNPSILYIKDLIESGKVGPTDAYEMMQKVPFYVKEPTYQLLMKVKELGSKDVVTKNQKLFSVSRLAFGTMIFKGCVENIYNPHPVHSKTYISSDKCSAMVQELIQKFKSSQDNMERSTYLRAIKNTRTEEAMQFLINVVKSHEYETLLRKAAAWGLYPYIENHADEVARVMGPIFEDVHEDYVLRIYAFEVLLLSHPTAELFSHVVLMMSKEQNQKLNSYIYSSLHTFANSTDPCHQKFTEHAKQAIEFLEYWDRDIMRHSTNRIFSVYNGKYNFGRSTQLVMIPNNNTVFPRELYMRQSVNLFGTNFDFFELGYVTEGRSMIDLFGDQFGPKALHGDQNEITNNYLKEVVEKLHLKDAFTEEMSDYEIYMKIFNQDIYVTRDLITDFKGRTDSTEMKIEDGKATMDIHSLGYVDGEYVIPNELGFPVSLKVQIPVAYHLGGTARVNMKQDHNTLRGINADLNMRFAMDFSVYSKMVVKTKTLSQYGYLLHTKGGMRIPLKGSIDFDFISNKKSIKYIPSTDSYDIMYYSTEPFTVGESVIPVEYAKMPKNRQYRVGHDYFGVGLNINATYDYYWNDYGSYRNFFKSFFHKSWTHDDYFYLSDKWYAGTRGFMDYVFLNPTGKPFHLNVRYEPSTNSPTTEFSLVTKCEYTKKYDSTRGQSVYKYTADLIGKGNTERKWQLQFHSSTNWPERDTRKVVVNYKRSPLPNYDSQGEEICYQGTTSYPEWAKVFTMWPRDLKINYNGQVKIGSKCDASDVKEFTVKGVAEKSEEQLSVEKSTLSYYKKCQEQKKKGYEMSDYCWKVVKDNGRLDQWTFDIDAKNIPEEKKLALYRLYSYIRHLMYNNLEILPKQGNNQENHVHITANFSYEHPVVDIKVSYPGYTAKYNHVYVPNFLPQWEPFTLAEPMAARWAKRILNYRRPICKISSKFIRTFDDVLYKAPMGSCYYLAFADARDHHVHILYRSVEDNNKYSKAIKVILNNDEIEIMPEGDHLMVKVNGKEEMQGKSAYIHQMDNQIYFAVFKVYGSRYMIKSKYYGISVMFDGEKSFIQATNFYRGRQLGLCGKFDGEKMNDFQGTDGKIYRDPSEFTTSYGVQQGGCTLH